MAIKQSITVKITTNIKRVFDNVITKSSISVITNYNPFVVI